jgi:hypothetical protein
MDYVKSNNPKPLYAAMAALGKFPEFVTKQAGVSEEDLDALHDASFADPANRELPVHTKAAAYLSAAYYFNEKEARPAGTEERLRAVASSYGFAGELDKLASTGLRNAEPAPEPDPVYALFFEVDGKQSGVYRLDTVNRMLHSAEAMVKDASAGRLALKDYRKGAMAVVKLASAAGVSGELPPAVLRMGADNLPSLELAGAVAVLRKYAGVSEENLETYSDIVKAASEEYEASGHDAAALDRWVEAWTELDKACGVKYSSTVLDPYSAFFSGIPMDEVAKLASSTVLLRDVMIPVADFAAVPENAFRYNFDDATATSLLGTQKLAAADAMAANKELAELPEDLQKRLLRVLAES